MWIIDSQEKGLSSLHSHSSYISSALFNGTLSFSIYFRFFWNFFEYFIQATASTRNILIALWNQDRAFFQQHNENLTHNFMIHRGIFVCLLSRLLRRNLSGSVFTSASLFYSIALILIGLSDTNQHIMPYHIHFILTHKPQTAHVLSLSTWRSILYILPILNSIKLAKVL